ncbi:hypothetical protein BH24CHL4_BH24CHL4_24260 [soil metagenome]
MLNHQGGATVLQIAEALAGQTGIGQDATTTRTRRQAMPERWQRAMLAGVQVRQLQGSGQWIVISASDPSVAYETDGVFSTCPAALLGYDPVCLHRATYWHAQGELGFDGSRRHRLPATCWRSWRHSGANRTILAGALRYIAAREDDAYLAV